MNITAAVVRDTGGPFVLEDLTLEEPRDDELLVRMVATGICHTDIYAAGLFPGPFVFGHEGAGVVERAGAAIRGFAPGDRVVMSFDSCGSCTNCRSGNPAYCSDVFALNTSGSRPDGSATLHDGSGAEVHGSFFAQSAFATYAIARQRNVVKVPDYVPDDVFRILGPLGCGVQTGAGAVMNSLKPDAGTSLVVAGAGGVGLSAVLGAAAIGLGPIIVVDINASRLAVARDLGATHTILGTDSDVAAQIVEITGGGADNAIDTTANVGVIRVLSETIRARGTVGVVGSGKPGAELTLDYGTVQFGRTVRGIVEGDAVPQLFIPHLIDLHLAGRFPFDRMVTTYPFAEIQDAVNASAEGSAIKAVLTF